MSQKKIERKRAVGFKMPEERFQVIQDLANARGTDVSAVLNQIVAEALPDLIVALARLKVRTPDAPPGVGK